jgi:hypothetical protein
MRRLALYAASIVFGIATAFAVAPPAAHGQASTVNTSSGISGDRPPCPSQGPACEPIGTLSLCAALTAGYSLCNPALGPAAENGEDANLGYDINAATGNLFLAQRDIHVVPPLGGNLDFVRYYNSQRDGADVGLGPNWTHSYSWSISIQGKTAVITADTGREILFTAVGSDNWKPQNGEFGALVTLGGYQYTDKYGTAYQFDPSTGRLMRIVPADNYPITINYSGGNQISSVSTYRCSASTPCSVSSLTFSYSGSHISSVTDPSGAVWLYGYTPPVIPRPCGRI